ncbi:MAG: SUMF1/EgtB/PvdO family nonheme iron enzyme [Spirochaetes bacterium]|nr:SUMF1/EgtB/PvdO family nonheme iron enzyme [Spirochaetota bacterium]
MKRRTVSKNGYAKIVVTVLLVTALPLLIFTITGCPNNVVNEVPAAYKVTYDDNGSKGGSVPEDSKLYKEGDTVTVLGNTENLVKTFYNFSGWNSAADGSGDSYSADDTFVMGTADVTLHAQWIEAAAKRDMISVPGGTYTQTDTNSNSFSHNISSFSIAKYEVTYELWYTVYQWAALNGYSFANAGTEGSDGTAGAEPTGAKYEPVTYINWRDAIVWCNAYSEMAGFTPVYYTDIGYTTPLKTSTDNTSVDTTAGSEDNPYVNWSANGYRLPTEGEWQYAASYQDGTNWTSYNYASGDSYPYDSSTTIGDYAWYSVNSSSKTQDAGTKTANQLNIYDMSGNVFEWCWDWTGAWPTDTQTDYKGLSIGSARIERGGNWYGDEYPLRVGIRYSYSPDSGSGGLGFRTARTP